MTQTNKYFEYTLDLIPGTTARSGDVDTGFNGAQTGFDGVEGDVFRGIRFTADVTPGESDFQISETPANRANKLLGFDANGMPAIIADAGSWSGDWATAQSYQARSFVRAPESHFFSIYIARVAHTSTDFATDLAANRWELMIDMEQIYKSRLRHQLIDDTDSPYDAIQGDDLMVDTSNGPVTINLPASPVITSPPVNIIHVDGDIVTNPITIARNGNPIMSLDEDMVVDVQNASFGLAFCNATLGWRVRGV